MFVDNRNIDNIIINDKIISKVYCEFDVVEQDAQAADTNSMRMKYSFLLNGNSISNQGGIIISENKIKVAIIDDNAEMCKSIANYLDRLGKFEIVALCYDGETGLKTIFENSPDVVILDILLPERDGISILENVREQALKEKPIFIMLTAVGQENITRQVLELGADYVILKPFNMDILARRIFELYSTKNKTFDNEFFFEAAPKMSREDHIINVLQKVGIPINLKGYNYLKIAISLCLEDNKLLESITKLLYPTIAKECGSTSSRVERDIRHALEVAWGRGKGQYYYEMINYTGPTDEKPTNGAFISTVVEKLRTQVQK